MWKRIVSFAMAAALAATTVFVPAPATKAAQTEGGISSEAAYFWDFENLADGSFANKGTQKSGLAVLKGSAATKKEGITAGKNTAKGADNTVLILAGGSKGTSYVDLPEDLYKDINEKTGFSYSFWLKPDESVGSYARVISSANAGSGDEFAFAPYAKDKVWNVLFDDTHVIHAPMPAEPVKGEWSFVTFTVNAEEIDFYINGEEAGSFGDSANLTSRLKDMGSLVKNALGRTYSNWTDPDAKVCLDDVCLYKRALTAEEAVQLAKEQGFTPTVATEYGGARELTDGTALSETAVKGEWGGISAEVAADSATGRYFVSASKGGKVLLDASQLGLKTSEDFSENLTLVEDSVKTEEGADTYTLTTGASREVKDTYRQIRFQLKNKEGHLLTVYLRIYEEGVAWRYELQGKAGQEESIQGEASEFVLPADSVIWGGYDEAGNYEYEYQKLKMSSVKAASSKYSVPLLANSGDNWMLFTEADVFSEADTYCASHLTTKAGERNLKFTFGKGSGSSLSMTYNAAGALHTPWRVAIFADNLNDIVNSTMTSSLNPEPDASLYADGDSWIRTGTVAWSWWSEAGDDPIEYQQQKDYIDFAAENGWEYVCLDFGWCLWDNYKEKVKELVDYGKEKGVGILLWYGVNNDNHTGSKDAVGDPAYPKYSLKTKEQLEEQFSWCEQTGVKGVKVDYYENDNKATMTQMYQCVTIAAKHKINVLLHGCTAPRGEIRTFPNILGYEGVRGAEYYKWNVGPSVSNCLTYVYNRNVVGGMDFTPVGTTIDQLPVTPGFQLAQTVAYQTGLQTMASSVYKLEGYKGLSFINDVPTQWDETRLLGGYPGKDMILARRSGQSWYLAAMTANAQNPKIALNFLGEGSYKAYIYKDNKDGSDVEIEEKEVTKDSVLELALADNGGAAVKITKEDMKTDTVYDAYTYYEAEDDANMREGNASVGANQFASGKKQVVALGGSADSKLTFKNVTAPAAGVYEVKLYYACGVDRRVVFSVNGGPEIRSRKLNAGVNTLAMERFYVALNEGNNTISFGNAKAKAPNIDRIAVSAQAVQKEATVTDLTEDEDEQTDDEQDGKTSAKKILVRAKGYDAEKITLIKGKKVRLAVSVKPKKASQKVKFASSKKKVATVNGSGMVRAKKAGKTVITITAAGGKKKKLTVRVVNQRVANRKLKLTGTKAVLKKKSDSCQIGIKSLTKQTTDPISYKVASGKKFIRVDKYGKVTVKKWKNKASATVLVTCGTASQKMKIQLKK